MATFAFRIGKSDALGEWHWRSLCRQNGQNYLIATLCPMGGLVVFQALCIDAFSGMVWCGLRKSNWCLDDMFLAAGRSSRQFGKLSNGNTGNLMTLVGSQCCG